MKWICLLMLGLACSLAARRPTYVVRETRIYNRQVAWGEARVFTAQSSHSRLAGARAWLVIAMALASTPADAYQAAARGVSELGSNYAASGVYEETHVKKMTATYEHEMGHDPLAAELMVRVLRSRIAMYPQRYAAEVE